MSNMSNVRYFRAPMVDPDSDGPVEPEPPQRSLSRAKIALVTFGILAVSSFIASERFGQHILRQVLPGVGPLSGTLDLEGIEGPQRIDVNFAIGNADLPDGITAMSAVDSRCDLSTGPCQVFLADDKGTLRSSQLTCYGLGTIPTPTCSLQAETLSLKLSEMDRPLQSFVLRSAGKEAPNILATLATDHNAIAHRKNNKGSGDGSSKSTSTNSSSNSTSATPSSYGILRFPSDLGFQEDTSKQFSTVFRESSSPAEAVQGLSLTPDQHALVTFSKFPGPGGAWRIVQHSDRDGTLDSSPVRELLYFSGRLMPGEKAVEGLTNVIGVQPLDDQALFGGQLLVAELLTPPAPTTTQSPSHTNKSEAWWETSESLGENPQKSSETPQNSWGSSGFSPENKNKTMLRIIVASTAEAEDATEISEVCLDASSLADESLSETHTCPQPIKVSKVLQAWTTDSGVSPASIQGIALLNAPNSHTETSENTIGPYVLLLFGGTGHASTFELIPVPPESIPGTSNQSDILTSSPQWKLVDGGHDRACGLDLTTEGNHVEKYKDSVDLQTCRDLCVSKINPWWGPWSTASAFASEGGMTASRISSLSSSSSTGTGLSTGLTKGAVDDEEAAAYTLAAEEASSEEVSLTAAAANFQELKGYNCYAGAGAVPVPGRDMVSNWISLDACKEACLADTECTAITVHSAENPGPCWFRMNVDQSGCIQNSPYNTWLQGGGSSSDVGTLYNNLECSPGQGGAALIGDGAAAQQVTLETCKEMCLANSACAAISVVHDATSGPCYLRSSVNLNACASSSTSDTWVIRDIAPTPAPTPAPTTTPTTTPAPTPAPTPASSSTDFELLKGYNCHPGAGAEAVPGKDLVGNGMSLEACKAACAAEAQCTAITVHAMEDPGHCWFRMNLNPTGCIQNSPYDTWVRGASSPTPSPSPTPSTTPAPTSPTPAPTPEISTTSSAPTAGPGQGWFVCSFAGNCNGQGSLVAWTVAPSSLISQVGDLSSLPTVLPSTYDGVATAWTTNPPTFRGKTVTLDVIADFMRTLLAEDPFGTGASTVPWIDFGPMSTTVAITQRQLAFIVTNVLVGNTLVGVQNGLSAALSRCSTNNPPTDTFVYSLLSLLAILSQELGTGQGKVLVGARPRNADDSWRNKLTNSLTEVTVCQMQGSPFNMTSANNCGKKEFMGGSLGSRVPDQALTDIAGGVVGGGAQLCEMANSQDESLVQFYPETLAFAFFRADGQMLPSPFTLLGARLYMNSISGQTTADPPLRNRCGSLPSTNWLNENIQTESVSTIVSDWVVQIPASSFVAVASSAWWIYEPGACDHVDALNNDCMAQRQHYDPDITQWYQAYEASMYDSSVQGAFGALVKSVGTGPWGAGVWWGDSQMYFLIVWLATSLVSNLALDYYVYTHFVENPGNQCFVLGGPDACKKCLEESGMSWQITPDHCGTLSAWDMLSKFQGQTAADLYNALGRVGSPPTQVFDTLSNALRRLTPRATPRPERQLSSMDGPFAEASGGSCEELGLYHISNVVECEEAGRWLNRHAHVASRKLGPDRCQVLPSTVELCAHSPPRGSGKVHFERVTGRGCNTANLIDIQTQDVCAEAAWYLGLDTGSTLAASAEDVPPQQKGCFYSSLKKKLLMGYEAKAGDSVRLCLAPEGSVKLPQSTPPEPYCKGIEYDSQYGFCRLWYTDIPGSVYNPGTVCLARTDKGLPPSSSTASSGSDDDDDDDDDTMLAS